MKLFRMLGRSIRDAFKSVIRNFSLSLASISCITITLIIVAIAIIASFNVNNFTEEIEKDLTIVIFLENDVNEEEIADVRQELKKMSNVDKITFKSKQEVKEEIQSESEVFNTVLNEWEDDESPLKDTFQVKVKEIEQIKNTAEKIEKFDNVSVVRYGEGMVDQMISAFTSIKNVTYAVVIALNFDGYLFSELIKLIQPEPFIYTTSLIILGIGILVGMIGSASAVKKYLKI